MKKLFIFMLVALTLIFSADAKFKVVNPDAYLDFGENEIIGIKYPIPTKQLLKVLGPPTQIYRGPYVGIPPAVEAPNVEFLNRSIYFYNKVGFISANYHLKKERITVKEPYIWGADIFDRSAVTKRGLAVGDTEERLLELYGEPTAIDKAKGTNFSGNYSARFDKTYYYKIFSPKAEGITMPKDFYIYLNKGIVTAISVSF